ncbi:MAG: hypothetical protein GW903_09280 [Alphaproteobacteria bacterium]|nr:hypothetical protein [Alphaproteobacteria bacterium]NCQ89059.1 hypothetical protein [Alphaproteobacteria bacterium]NCT07959.1 hypothetical protein [Alphaproteobacteria bacterium]
MSTASRITTLGAALAMAATSATGQEAQAPTPPEVNSQYSIASVDIENGTATLKSGSQGQYQDTLSCDQLASQQERIEYDIISQASTFLALGTNDQRFQEHQLQLGFGLTTLAEVYRYASADAIDRDQKYNGLKYAAELGADRNVYMTAQIEAGCFTPKGTAERGLPSPAPSR